MGLGYRNFAATFGDGFLDPIFNFQLCQVHNCGEFGNEKKPSAIKHALFAERQWLYPAEMNKVLENFRDVKNRTRSHLFGIFFEPVFPIFLCKELITGEE